MTVDVGTTVLPTLERQPSLTAQAYSSIKETIINGAVAAGSPCTEAGLARQLGVSRAPVREAMRQLQEEGFVVQTSATGFAIASFSTRTIEDVYGIRLALEGMSAKLAFNNIPGERVEEEERKLHAMDKLSAAKFATAFRDSDFTFHDLWVAHSGNEMLSRHIGRLRDHVVRIANFVPMPATHFKSARQEHIDILDAIRSGRMDGLQGAVETHIVNVRDRLLETADKLW